MGWVGSGKISNCSSISAQTDSKFHFLLLPPLLLRQTYTAQYIPLSFLSALCPTRTDGLGRGERGTKDIGVLERERSWQMMMMMNKLVSLFLFWWVIFVVKPVLFCFCYFWWWILAGAIWFFEEIDYHSTSWKDSWFLISGWFSDHLFFLTGYYNITWFSDLILVWQEVV